MSELTDKETLALKDRATEFVDLAVSQGMDLRNVATMGAMITGITIARFNPQNQRGISDRMLRGLTGVILTTFNLEMQELREANPKPPPPQ